MTDIILVFVGTAASLISYQLNNKYKLSAVMASALPSLLVALFLYGFPTLLPEELSMNIPLVFMGSSFIGMSSSKILPNWIWSIIAGIIFGVIYVDTSIFFTGYGGGLGTTACISVLVSFAMRHLHRRYLLKRDATL